MLRDTPAGNVASIILMNRGRIVLGTSDICKERFNNFSTFMFQYFAISRSVKTLICVVTITFNSDLMFERKQTQAEVGFAKRYVSI